MFVAWGFTGGNNSYADAMIYASQSAVSMDPRSITIDVNRTGEVLRLILRFGGPLFIGLAALAVRNQIKR
jgi:hypothetical protein